MATAKKKKWAKWARSHITPINNRPLVTLIIPLLLCPFRTAVNYQSGVRTPAAGVITGSVVLLSLAFLTPLFKLIPKASLAAVIIIALIKLIQLPIMKKLWKINSE